MKLSLPDNVSSPQDIASLVSELRQYRSWLSHESIKKRVKAHKVTEAPLLSKGATDFIKLTGAKSVQDLDGLIKRLQTHAGKAPIVHITLAAPPTGGIKKQLVGWCRKNISPDVLVTFQFNSVILGGMVVRYKSRIFDWSFRRQILVKRQKFPEVLRNVR